MIYIFINEKSIIQDANYAMFQNFLREIFWKTMYFYKIHNLWNTVYYQTDPVYFCLF